ncbi:MAG: SurA N-terminal domain-containing protein [Puniceicoccales bacterium]|nr:SurA N-terminal domain-containing protein [Puniceicoccales bacterium]
MATGRLTLATFFLLTQPFLFGVDDLNDNFPRGENAIGEGVRADGEFDSSLEAERSTGFGNRRYVNGIVATANGRLITAGELQQELMPTMAQIERQATSQSDFDRRVREAARKIVDRLVDRALIVQEFERSGMKIPEAQKNFQLDEFIRNNFNGSRVEFAEKLRERGKTLGQFKREMEEGFIVDWMRSRIRHSRSEISPLQVSQYYQDRREEFYVPPAVRMGQIYVADGGEDIREVVEQLRNGEDFATVRDRYYPSGARAEEEWVSQEDLHPELCALLGEMEIGDYAGPLAVGGGSLVVVLLARREGTYLPLEEVQSEIEGHLYAQRSEEAYERWLAKLRRQAHIQYYL